MARRDSALKGEDVAKPIPKNAINVREVDSRRDPGKGHGEGNAAKKLYNTALEVKGGWHRPKDAQFRQAELVVRLAYLLVHKMLKNVTRKGHREGMGTI